MAKNDRPDWTEDERESVKEMLRLDYTCSGIGRTFHPPMTRNAVIGRIVRDPELRMCRPALAQSLRNKLRAFVDNHPRPKLALPSAVSIIEPLKARKARSPDPMMVEHKRDRLATDDPPLPPPSVVPVHGMRLVPLYELSRSECRWPVSEDHSVTGYFLFCGKATKPGCSYCGAHEFAAQPALRRIAAEGGRLGQAK